MLKTRKPIVVATTKNDVQKVRLVREIERLLDRKEFRGKIRLIETSGELYKSYLELQYVGCKRASTKKVLCNFTD